MPPRCCIRAGARFSASIRIFTAPARRSPWPSGSARRYDHAEAPRLRARRRCSPTKAACSSRRARRAGAPMSWSIVGELPADPSRLRGGACGDGSRPVCQQCARILPDRRRQDASSRLGRHAEATRLSCGKAGLGGTLAALRAQCAGRQVSAPVSNFDRFAEALAGARFPGLPVFRPCRRRAGAGDAARAGRRSQPQVARLRPASAGKRKRLGQHARLHLDDRLSAAHRLCARLSGIRSLALRCGAA